MKYSMILGFFTVLITFYSCNQLSKSNQDSEPSSKSLDAEEPDDENVSKNVSTETSNETQESNELEANHSDETHELQVDDSEVHANDIVESPSPSYAPQPQHWCEAQTWRRNLLTSGGEWHVEKRYEGPLYSSVRSSCVGYLNVELVSTATADKRCRCCNH